MPDIGFWELCIIGVVLLLVLGPERMPEVAKQIGYWTTRARRTVNQLRNEMRQELDALPTEQINKAKENIEKLGKDIASAGADINAQMSEKINIEDQEVKPTETKSEKNSKDTKTDTAEAKNVTTGTAEKDT